MNTIKVSGKNIKHKVLLYALSTCVWCKRTKKFLADKDITYEYIDVDLCSREDREAVRRDILDKGGRVTYPTLIINDKKIIHGFHEEDFKKALEI